MSSNILFQVTCQNDTIKNLYNGSTVFTNANSVQIANNGVFGEKCIFIPTNNFAYSATNYCKTTIPGAFINSPEYTLSFWFKLSSSMKNKKAPSYTNYTIIQIYGIGTEISYNPESDSNSLNTPYLTWPQANQTKFLLEYDKWNHVVITKDSSKNFRHYLNSELVYTGISSSSTEKNSYDLYIGAYYNNVSVNNQAQDVYIDRIMLFNYSNSALDNNPPSITKPQYLSAMTKYKAKEDYINNNTYVSKVSGKDLSTNDYTTDEKTKLSGIESGAEVNVLETISVNNSALTPDSNGNVNINMSSYALADDLLSTYKYKGSVYSYENLPNSNLTVGDTYNIETANSTAGIVAGDNVTWTGTGWDKIGGTIDMSNYVPVEQGKGLSHIDVTQAMKTTWDNIENDSDVTNADFDFLFPPPPIAIDSKFKSCLIVKDGTLRDLAGNITWNNTAQIVEGAGVYGGDCLYFDNSQTETVDEQTKYIIDSTLVSNSFSASVIDLTKPKWTFSFWFKLNDLNYDVAPSIDAGSGPSFSVDGSDNYIINLILMKTGTGSIVLSNKLGNTAIYTPFILNGNVSFYTNQTASITIQNTNTWVHVALVRNENNISMYLNGNRTNLYNAFDTSSIDINNIPDQNIIIQQNFSSNNSANYYKTYFDEFIFVEDALWTDTFTPPQDYIYKSI